MKTRVLFVSVVLILACAAAGCVQPSQEEAQAQLCQDLGKLGVALQDMQGLNATSSVGDIRDARDQVQSAMEDVRSSADQVTNVRVDELNAAYDNLDRAVKSVPDDASVPEALQAIRPEVQGVVNARQNLTTELNCPQS